MCVCVWRNTQVTRSEDENQNRTQLRMTPSPEIGTESTLITGNFRNNFINFEGQEGWYFATPNVHAFGELSISSYHA